MITAEDLTAVSLLSVRVPARAALAILESGHDATAELLAAIPANLDLVDADDAAIGRRSAAQRLWEHLIAIPGIGSVTASKILARKRPRLLPVVDSVVLRTLKHPGTGYWHDLRHHLVDEDRHLNKYLEAMLQRVQLDGQVSAIRAFDVLVWLTGKTHRPQRQPVFDPA